jgi:hypothetical protein
MLLTGKKFPILRHRSLDKDLPNQPAGFPWELVAPHEKQAEANHCGQSLKRLAERGGLCPIELMAILKDEPYPKNDPDSELRRVQKAIDFLDEYVRRAMEKEQEEFIEQDGMAYIKREQDKAMLVVAGVILAVEGTDCVDPYLWRITGFSGSKWTQLSLHDVAQRINSVFDEGKKHAALSATKQNSDKAPGQSE